MWWARTPAVLAAPHAAHERRVASRGDARDWSRSLDVVTTILLALATLATAWAAYQARQWTGEQSQGYSHATAKRIAVTAPRRSPIGRCRSTSPRSSSGSMRVHGATLRWRASTAPASRDEFKPAFAAWLATRRPRQPGGAADAVRDAAVPAESERRRESARGRRGRGLRSAGREPTARTTTCSRSSFSPSALFFEGISTRLQTPSTRVAILALGCRALLGSRGLARDPPGSARRSVAC